MVDLSNPIPNPIPKQIVDGAVRFHGHLGPFLILGLKAGLFANHVLGKDYFKTTVIVETEPTPPCSCFLDAIQFVTGCTMGKGNVALETGHSLRALFMKRDKKLKMSLKDYILESLKRISSKEMCEKTATNLSKKSVLQLFDVEEYTNDNSNGE